MHTRIILATLVVMVMLQIHLVSSKSLGRDFVISDMSQLAKRIIRNRRDVSSGGDVTVEKFHVKSKINSRYSVVSTTSLVRNDADTSKEIQFSMQLPKTAFISNFSMEIDGKVYVGVVKSKETAKKEYDSAVSSGRSAALVSTKVRNTQVFDVSVNIEAGGAVEFVLEYQELLLRKLGKYVHSIYATPGSKYVIDYVVEVIITEAIGITELEAKLPDDDDVKGDDDMMDGYNNVDVRRSGTMGYVYFTPSKEQQMSKTTPSITIKYDVERENVGGELLIRDGYFVHFFAPADLPIIPKNVVFIIDKSGSMMGRKMEQTKEAMITILNDLGPNDRFNIISFERNVDTWKDGEMIDVTETSLTEAKAYVDRIIARGGTNFNDAVLKGISLLQTVTDGEASDMNRASMIIMLTDGEPTSGVTNTEDIRQNIKSDNEGRYSIFCLGFGESLDHNFLKQVSNENQGISRRIYEDSDAPLQLKGFFDEVAAPMLAHVVIKYSAGTKRVTKNDFDKFFAGSEILVAGRLGNGDGDFDVTASVTATQVDGSFSVTSRGEKLDRTFAEEGTFDMEKLWAYLTISQLVEKKGFSKSQNQTKRLEEKILKNSLKYNFVTPVTSMIATKPDETEEEETIVVDDDFVPDFVPPVIHSYSASAGRSNFYPSAGRSNSRVVGGRGGSYHHFSAGRSGGSYHLKGRPRIQPTFLSRYQPQALPMKVGAIGAPGPTYHHQPLRTLAMRYPTTTGYTTTTGYYTTTTAPPATTVNWGAHTTYPTTVGYPSAGTWNPNTTPDTQYLYDSVDDNDYDEEEEETTEAPTAPPVTTTIPQSPLDEATLPRDGFEQVGVLESRNISSPRYPGLYPNGQRWVWEITKDANAPNAPLELEFVKIDLEVGNNSCEHDRVIIYSYLNENEFDGEPHVLCGYKDFESKQFSAPHKLVVLLETDNIVQGRGFFAKATVY